jgi:hypothetical protein
LEAETLARGRWRPVAKALDRRDKIQRRLVEARHRSGELHAALPAAERRDREARGHAVAEGRSRPQLEAPQIISEREDLQQQIDDLQAAAEVVDRELLELRERSRENWRASCDRTVERAKAAVLKAGQELEAAVSAFEDEIALRDWAHAPVDQGSTDPMGGRLTHTGVLTARWIRYALPSTAWLPDRRVLPRGQRRGESCYRWSAPDGGGEPWRLKTLLLGRCRRSSGFRLRSRRRRSAVRAPRRSRRRVPRISPSPAEHDLASTKRGLHRNPQRLTTRMAALQRHLRFLDTRRADPASGLRAFLSATLESL